MRMTHVVGKCQNYPHHPPSLVFMPPYIISHVSQDNPSNFITINRIRQKCWLSFYGYIISLLSYWLQNFKASVTLCSLCARDLWTDSSLQQVRNWGSLYSDPKITKFCQEQLWVNLEEILPKLSNANDDNQSNMLEAWET